MKTYRGLPPVFGTQQYFEAGQPDPFYIPRARADELFRQAAEKVRRDGDSPEVFRKYLYGAMAGADRVIKRDTSRALLEHLLYWNERHGEAGMPVQFDYVEVKHGPRIDALRELIQAGPPKMPRGMRGLSSENFAASATRCVQNLQSIYMLGVPKHELMLRSMHDFANITCLGPLALRMIYRKGREPKPQRRVGMAAILPAHVGIAWAYDFDSSKTAFDSTDNVIGRSRPKRIDHVLHSDLAASGIILGSFGNRIVVAVDSKQPLRTQVHDPEVADAIRQLEPFRLYSKMVLRPIRWDEVDLKIGNTSNYIPSGFFPEVLSELSFGDQTIDADYPGALSCLGDNPAESVSGALVFPVDNLSSYLGQAQRLTYGPIREKTPSSAFIHGDKFSIITAPPETIAALVQELEARHGIDLSLMAPLRSAALDIDGRQPVFAGRPYVGIG